MLGRDVNVLPTTMSSMVWLFIATASAAVVIEPDQAIILVRFTSKHSAQVPHLELAEYDSGSDTRSGIRAGQEARIRLILARLNVSRSPQDMNLPGLYLHQLKGKRRGTWSVRVSGNWRMTFGFDGENAIHVDLEDYH